MPVEFQITHARLKGFHPFRIQILEIDPTIGTGLTHVLTCSNAIAVTILVPDAALTGVHRKVIAVTIDHVKVIDMIELTKDIISLEDFQSSNLCTCVSVRGLSHGLNLHCKASLPYINILTSNSR